MSEWKKNRLVNFILFWPTQPDPPSKKNIISNTILDSYLIPSMINEPSLVKKSHLELNFEDDDIEEILEYI